MCSMQISIYNENWNQQRRFSLHSLKAQQNIAASPKIQKWCLHKDFMVDNNLFVLCQKFWVVLNFTLNYRGDEGERPH